MLYYAKISIFAIVLTVTQLSGTAAGQKQVQDRQQKINSEAARLVLQGATAEAMKDYKNALLAYQEAAVHDPASSGIQRALGETYLRLGRVESGLICLNKAIELDPLDVKSHTILADTYNELSRYSEAETAYKEVLSLQPESIDALGRLIFVMLEQKKSKEAYKEFAKFAPPLQNYQDYYLQIGHLFLRDRAYDEAIKIYEQVQKRYPEIENTYLGLGTAYVSKEEDAKAISWYETGMQEDPAFEDVRAELRNLYMRTEKYNDALRFFTTILKQDSSEVANWLELGRFTILSGDTLEAVDIYAKTARRFPRNENAWLVLGAAQESIADTNGVVQSYRRALEENPRFDRVRNLLRNIYVRREQWADAIALYERLIANDSTDVANALEVANLYYIKGDTATAFSRISDLETRFPEDWRIPYSAGRMSFIGSDWRLAESYFRRTLEYEKNPNVWILLGQTHLFREELDEAEQVFRDAVKLYGEHEQINFFLASVLSQLGKSSEALPFVLKALDKDPNNVNSLMVLAACYSDLEYYERSDDIYEKILEGAPDNHIVLNNFAYSLAERNIRLDESLEMVQMAIEAEPANGSYLDTIGWIYYKMGEYQKAYEYISKSIEVRATSAEVWEHLGDVCEKLGKAEKAREYWRKALELDEGRQYLEEKIEAVIKNGRF